MTDYCKFLASWKWIAVQILLEEKLESLTAIVDIKVRLESLTRHQSIQNYFCEFLVGKSMRKFRQDLSLFSGVGKCKH